MVKCGVSFKTGLHDKSPIGVGGGGGATHNTLDLRQIPTILKSITPIGVGAR